MQRGRSATHVLSRSSHAYPMSLLSYLFRPSPPRRKKRAGGDVPPAEPPGVQLQPVEDPGQELHALMHTPVPGLPEQQERDAEDEQANLPEASCHPTTTSNSSEWHLVDYSLTRVETTVEAALPSAHEPQQPSQCQPEVAFCAEFIQSLSDGPPQPAAVNNTAVLRELCRDGQALW